MLIFFHKLHPEFPNSLSFSSETERNDILTAENGVSNSAIMVNKAAEAILGLSRLLVCAIRALITGSK